MATTDQLQASLACWFQLNKAVLDTRSGDRLQCPSPLAAGRYSPEFDGLWQHLTQQGLHHFCFEGHGVSLANLLDGTWEILPCARCSMPIPLRSLGLSPINCVCADLENWPNFDLPAPRAPLDWRQSLVNLQTRLQRPTFASLEGSPSDDSTPSSSPPAPPCS